MFKFITYGIRYLPLIIALVKTVELVAGASTGKEKKAAVLTLLDKFLRDTLGVARTDDILEIAGQLVDLVVSTLNFFGVFSKDDVDVEVPAAAPEVTPAKATAVVNEVLEVDKRIAELLSSDTFKR